MKNTEWDERLVSPSMHFYMQLLECPGRGRVSYDFLLLELRFIIKWLKDAVSGGDPINKEMAGEGYVSPR